MHSEQDVILMQKAVNSVIPNFLRDPLNECSEKSEQYSKFIDKMRKELAEITNYSKKEVKRIQKQLNNTKTN